MDIGKKISNPAKNLRDTSVIETDFADNETLLNINGRTVITKDFKYIVYNKGNNKEQLFDLIKDPGEINNLAANTSYKKRLITMHGYLKQWCTKNGDKFGANL